MSDIFDLRHVVLILTVGFVFASFLGYIFFRLKLSPIIGYLLAGFLIGPFSPGFVADLKLTEQLAEIGVILMLFGVGLHFEWGELLKVKHIAIPGAIIQTAIATLFTVVLTYLLGWPIEAGIIAGLCIGVASTVVLARALTEENLLKTEAGHISIGWLIVEDIITVLVLLLIPTLGASFKEPITIFDIGKEILLAIFKMGFLIFILFTIGKKIVVYLENKIKKVDSSELYTLTFLAITFFIAVGSSIAFGVSFALGAFLAGMLIRQTDKQAKVLHHFASMKNAFVAIFFITVGMLFNPNSIIQHFYLFATILGIVIFIKPLTALIISYFYQLPKKNALIVAIALAQIGEFSFILGEEANKMNLLPDEGFDVIVAAAFVSIAINPILFKRALRRP